MPPIQYSHTKEGLTELLQNSLVKSYKRKRLKLNANDDVVEHDNTKNTMDMELESSDENTQNSLVQFPEPSASSNKSNENEASCDSNQMSLNELKRKQEELLKALAAANENSSDSNSNSVSDNGNSIENTQQNESTECTAVENNSNNNNDDEHIVHNESSLSNLEINETIKSVNIERETISNTPNTPTTMSGRSTEKVYGTPLLKQVSPFSNLPSGEKWSIGVSDVIDFENLPDATGTYHKMSGIIQKVRTVVKRIHDDSDHDDS